MPFIAQRPEKYLGQVIGSGQCVAFVERAANVPHTFSWRQGVKVRGDLSLSEGAAIATFQNERYINNTTGLSHAAIYLGQSKDGIIVLDQWMHQGSSHPVSKRLIRFKNGKGKPVNDGDAYYVVEVKK